LGDLCRCAKGPQTTKELALALMRAKGLDLADAVLAKGIGSRLIHSLRGQRLWQLIEISRTIPQVGDCGIRFQ